MTESSKSSLLVPKTTIASSLKKPLTAGSATGNPRNKCALKPGHSLMDWIRLGSTGVDLSGTRGAIVPVSSLELAKHCKQTDAWMAIRGKVYNVTRYMDFHPGGTDELMKGAGKDATKIFEEVHAWVNYEQLLSKCLIGPLRNIVTVDLGPPKVPPITSTANAQFKTPKISALTINQLIEITPRFDWIQKTSNLTIFAYTQPFCNPGVVLECDSHKKLSFRILLKNNVTHLWTITLVDAILWPVNVKISNETGKIELTLTKEEPKLWTSFGDIVKEKINECELLQFPYKIVNKQQINHNSFALAMNPVQDVLMVSPVGYHFNITDVVNETLSTKSYTPVPSHYTNLDNTCNATVNFLIKSYNEGGMAKNITSKSLGGILSISQPKGYFDLKHLTDHYRVALIAAGSGITPMLTILDHLLARVSRKIESVFLYFYNKKAADIWCFEKLNKIATIDNRLNIVYTLSDPDDDWKGAKGQITSTDISQLLNHNVSFIGICGPPKFNDRSEDLLTKIDFNMQNVHIFKS